MSPKNRGNISCISTLTSWCEDSAALDKMNKEYSILSPNFHVRLRSHFFFQIEQLGEW